MAASDETPAGSYQTRGAGELELSCEQADDGESDERKPWRSPPCLADGKFQHSDGAAVAAGRSRLGLESER